jgi:predicted RNA-binding protein with PUA-like domain
LVKDGVAEWDGVRNFQARNMLRDEIKEGDEVLFYHSSTDPMAVVGVASVVKGGHGDKTAWDAKSAHPDPKSTPDNPIWYVVDIKPLRKLKRPVTLQEMRANPKLVGMPLLKRGMRLSVQPVSKDEFETVCAMAEKPPQD